MPENINDTRRGLLAAGALLVGGWGKFACAASDAATNSDTVPLKELNYDQVQFSAGPLQRQASENHRFVLSLDEDALLRPFRERAGQKAPGSDLGGWYDTYAFAPGATFGQWMSALSRYYAITGDAATHDKVQRLVRGFANTVDARGSFYIENRFPAYTYDKLTGGLLDAERLGRDTAARATLRRATQSAIPFLPDRAMPRNEHAHPPQDFTEHAWDESYTVPENQFLAWRQTGDRQHLALAQRFLYEEFFGALARGENALPGKHAYSHVNGLSSAAQAYVSLNDPIYLSAARNGFDMVAAQSFATGGWGPDEHFIVPGGGALGASLTQEHKSFETPCGAYAHFKLTRYLLRITRDSRYGDSMERVLYNTVLGATPIQSDGRAFYYSDYTMLAKKGFHPDHWPCCSGTLPMIAADYRISTCFADSQGVYVNLYVPARVNLNHGNQPFAFSIETEYPYSSTVLLTIQNPTPQTLTVNLRIPAWAHGAALSVNGKRRSETLQPGRFAAIRREWRTGDRIELDLPLAKRLESVDTEHPDTVALIAGPLVLMRIDSGSSDAAISREALLGAQRAPHDAHAWQVTTPAGPARLKPFLDIDAESYSAYQTVLPS